MRKLFFLILFVFLSYTYYAQDENLTWVSSLGGSGWDNGFSITSDSLGNVYTAGTFEGLMIVETANTIDSLTALGIRDIFIEKIDSSGVIQWVKSIGTFLEDGAFSIKVNSNNEIIICGNYKGIIDMDPSDSTEYLSGNTNYYFAFVLKLNSDGDFVWAKGINGRSSAYSLFIDEADEIYITGTFQGSPDFDPGPAEYDLSSNGYSDMFLWKLDNNGEFLMAKSIGGSSYDSASEIELDQEGNIFISGEFSETVDFDPGAGVNNLTANVTSDIFLLKLDNQGDFIWVKSFGGTGTDRLRSMSIDNNSNVYLTGMYENTVDFDPGSGVEERSSANFSYDLFVLKLDENGIFEWVNTYGNTGWDAGSAIYAKEDVFVVGFFENSVDFDLSIDDDYILSPVESSRDGFVLKLDSNGAFLWVNSIGGVSSKASDIYWEDSGNVYVLAEFFESITYVIGNDTNIISDNDEQGAVLIQKYNQVPCSNFQIIEDSIVNLTCSTTGYFSGHAVFGTEPYNYVVNQVNLVDELAFVIDNNGIYTIEVQDAGICSLTQYLQVESPSYMNDFDLSANLVIGELRPGFTSSSFLDTYNDGCDTTSGMLTLVLDSLLSFDSASIEPDLFSPDSTSISWNFMPMNYDSAHFVPQVFLNTSTDAQIGDTVCIDVIITPQAGDADTLNNVKHYCFPIINGYDPNDKQVYPQGICNDHFILNDELLTYTIRFQNTGNAEAINIHIIDSLSSYLDLSSVNVVSSSHDMHLEVLDGNVLDFKFDNIYLPDSNSNEVASHGYVIFEVSPLVGLDYIEITNKSEIYFDFNPAVVTNTVYNTLVEVLLSCADIAASVNEASTNQNSRVYPNPNTGKFNLAISDIDKATIKLFNLNGQLIYQREDLSGGVHQIEIDGPIGIYFLELSNDVVKEYYKVIKE